ncbi:hypothetical protein BVY01_02275 [bacterium I07]|nr:hypothetical protein BVY01_02275 [bacterium I07]
MKWFMKIEQLLSKILKGLIVFCSFCILVLIITLVILRYGFNSSIVGANELVVILFIYTSALGASLVIGQKGHIAIPYFIEKLPPAFRKTVEFSDYLLIALLNGVMIWYSFRWIRITGGYLTAVLRIPQLYAQIVIPIGCGLAIFYCIHNIVILINPKTDTV